MIYPHNFEVKVGFDKVRKLITDSCISPMGKQFVEKIRFSSNRDAITKMLEQVDEFVQLTLFGKPFPTDEYIDLRDTLRGLKTPGSYIEKEGLFNLFVSLRTIYSVINYISKLDNESFPRTHELTAELYFPEDIFRLANNIIDEKGEIKDNASDKLAEIRKQIISHFSYSPVSNIF